MTRFVDHLIFFSPDLESGMDYIEERLGTRPVPGGRHPDLGTHNALLGLGPECYLEVMAPDPDNPRPARPEELGIGPIAKPRLATWILRAENIEEVRAQAEGIGLGEIQHGSRDNPDGTRLSWRITTPFVFPQGGVVPFLISWGDTPHPSTMLPQVGSLVGLVVEHPDPEAVRHAFERLEVDVPVARGGKPRLVALIDTAQGSVELE